MNSRRFNRLFRISRHRFDDRKVDITQNANRNQSRASALWALFTGFDPGG
jgi:hypothetical protein